VPSKAAGTPALPVDAARAAVDAVGRAAGGNATAQAAPSSAPAAAGAPPESTDALAAALGRNRSASAGSDQRAAPPADAPRAPESAAGSRLTGADTAVRTDAMQVQAASGAQQSSVSLAAAVPLVDAGDRGSAVDQIVRAISLQVRDGIGVARVRLQPDHLGEVQIDLKVDRERVSAVLHVERSDVRAQIEGQGQTLRAGLAAQGLHLEELTVRDDGQGGQGQGRQHQQQSGRRRRQTADRQFDLDA
jgi:flagellar hook-length control protein FliK